MKITSEILTAKLTSQDIKAAISSDQIKPQFSWINVKIESDLNNEFPYSFPFDF